MNTYSALKAAMCDFVRNTANEQPPERAAGVGERVRCAAARVAGQLVRSYLKLNASRYKVATSTLVSKMVSIPRAELWEAIRDVPHSDNSLRMKTIYSYVRGKNNYFMSPMYTVCLQILKC